MSLKMKLNAWIIMLVPHFLLLTEARMLRTVDHGFEAIGNAKYIDDSDGFDSSLITNKARRAKKFVNERSPDDINMELISRRTQVQTCESNEQLFELEFTTDAYGYETSYKLQKRVAEDSWTTVDYGPKEDSKYDDNTTYENKICLTEGNTYKLLILDSGKDGICCENGRGTYKYSLDGVVKYDSNFQSTFNSSVVRVFTVALPLTSRENISSICGENKQQIRIEIKLDKFGDENSWELRKLSNNEVILSVDAGEYSANDSDQVEVCVEDGNYRFTLRDDTGDGICCRNGNGYYKLYMDGDLMVDERFYNSGIKVSHDIIVGYTKSLTMTAREEAYVDAHNWRRKKYHEEAGSTYVPLKWSKGLAEHASNWAQQLLSDCDVIGILHEPNQEQGENLAKNAGSGTWGQLYPVENIVRRWVEREVGWEYPHNAHLTQALWRSSKYLGCAESSKSMTNGATCHIQVCRYARAGNCNMAKYNPHEDENWKTPMLMDANPCGPACPPEGCY